MTFVFIKCLLTLVEIILIRNSSRLLICLFIIGFHTKMIFTRISRSIKHANNLRLLSQKSYTDIIFEKLDKNDNGIAVIGFNRAKARNSFGLNLVSEFEDSLQTINNDKHVKVVIIRSYVPGIFCAGKTFLISF